MTERINHLIDQNIVVESSEKPQHYSQKSPNLDDLKKMLKDDQEREKYHPIQILKAGLALINKNNKTEAKIPDDLIIELNLQNSEKIIQRAVVAKYILNMVSSILNLPAEHFSIGTSNRYVEVHNNSKSRSAIMPTHFGDGFEIFIPHDDYMYDLVAKDLPKICIGENFYLAQNARLDVGGKLQIGDRVFISRNAHRFGHTHQKNCPGIIRETLVSTQTDSPIVICDDALVGYDSDISPTTHYIGQNTIIGQKSVITSPWLGDFSIVVGNNKTIGYLPEQAYFKSEYPEHVNVETMVKIDWNGSLKEEWKKRYSEKLKIVLAKNKNLLSIKNKKILILGDAMDVSEVVNLIINDNAVDYITDKNNEVAFLLQSAQNHKNMSLRVRRGTEYFIQSNNTMYDHIIDNRQAKKDSAKIASWIKK